MATPLEKGKVYRLRNLPKHVDRQSAAELLSKHIDEALPQDIRISSLVSVIDSRVRVPTKTATLTFEKKDLITRFKSNNCEWTFKDPALESPLILDSHFSGLTPLNEVAPELHQYDCIAISGLVSHPLGSWQPHGSDKSFMWIRDELPQFLPTVRFILYGYNTQLHESTSFQRVTDLANSFVNVLQADGWTSPTAKRLIFLAHSLGGVLLKQAFLMLIGAGQQQKSISNLIAGAIFFGVPSRGMDINDVFRMLGDQPNKDALVSEISAKSDYLSRLEKKFAGASLLRQIKMYWAYETKLTPTITSVRNSHSRSGPGTVLERIKYRETVPDPTVWDNKVILESLRVPDRDLRMQQVDPAANCTFDWVYDNISTGLSEWLQRGEGTFWISGKPGSGKSTMMKFIHNDPRTSELLHQWRSRSREITASFFFHHRGNSIQKSFEGLLRSIISQILEKEPLMLQIRGLGTLQVDILNLAELCNLTKDATLDQDIKDIIRSLDFQPSLSPARVMSLEFKIYILILKHSTRFGSFPISNTRYLTWDPKNERDIEHIIRYHPLSDKYVSEARTILERHQSRVDIQNEIARDEWSRSRLENVLLRICSQTLLDLDLFLVLDALDEYDGRPEFVSGFLKDLTRPTGFPRTKVRILFSSRPWDVFQREFEASPGFRIHEHTEGDIRNYCVSSICSTFNEPGCLFQFVKPIVARSRGVFLWVKLVLHDLFRIVNDHSYAKDSLEVNLRNALDSMPDELEEYYIAIIERIPLATRWETYVVLESLLRYEGSITATMLRSIVACSTDRIYPNPTRWRLQRTSYNNIESQQFIRRVAGGLVDIASGYAQLMHQTVKEFIETPQFRHLVLGHNRADITEENGHSFLAKYFFFQNGYDNYIADSTRIPHGIDNGFFFHASEAERTTGVSLYDFFASFTDEDPCQWVASSLPFATFSSLQLYLEDAHKADPNAIANSTTVIFSLAATMAIRRSYNHRKIVECLVSKGLVVEKDLLGLSRILCAIWSIRQSEDGGKQYKDVAGELISRLKDTEIPIDWSRASIEEYANLAGLSRSTILYLCPLDIAARLLGQGANPNAEDNLGRSPLDYILSSRSVHPPDPIYLYRLSIELIKHGGLLRKTTPDEWSMYIHHLEKNGANTKIFKDYGFPAWGHTPNIPPSHAQPREIDAEPDWHLVRRPYMRPHAGYSPRYRPNINLP
ncbi:hypothetical protein K445DRAFT_11496 [Daldinia sp. EC12]|nr:hypothetical protein K445DRAFT_11496 [Daldinia sp. EC12]